MGTRHRSICHAHGRYLEYSGSPTLPSHETGDDRRRDAEDTEVEGDRGVGEEVE
jgi:hypothetical protein